MIKNIINDSKIKNNDTLILVKSAMLTSISVVLMHFEISFPFAPAFCKFDLSDLPAIVGSFLISPITGVIIEGLKVLLHGMTKGTESMWIGELANFLIGCTFILPASIIYKVRKTHKNILFEMVIGTISICVMGILFNIYIFIPLYSIMYGISLDNIIALGTAINSNINSIVTFVIFIMFPFNFLKGFILSVSTMCIYRKIRKYVDIDGYKNR